MQIEYYSCEILGKVILRRVRSFICDWGGLSALFPSGPFFPLKKLGTGRAILKLPTVLLGMFPSHIYSHMLGRKLFSFACSLCLLIITMGWKMHKVYAQSVCITYLLSILAKSLKEIIFCEIYFFLKCLLLFYALLLKFFSLWSYFIWELQFPPKLFPKSFSK